MKKHIFIMTLFALCLHLNQAHAQRYLPGMKALQVTAGMADGVHWNSDTDFACHFHLIDTLLLTHHGIHNIDKLVCFVRTLLSISAHDATSN